MELTNNETQGESAANEAAASATSRPVVSFSGSGGLNVAVWKHKTESNQDNYSIRLDRTYKDSEGNYKTTAYLREGDLLRTTKLLGQADEWIEQDKAKQRASSANRSR